VVYGDDAQMATNFPLVVIRKNATGHLFLARTSTFSTMGIATGKTLEDFSFEVSGGTETGASTVYVVTNGIVSAGKAITLQ